MSRNLRAIVAVIAVAGITFVVYRHEHRSLSLRRGGGVPLGVLVAKRSIPKGTSGDIVRKNAAYYRVTLIRPGKAETGAILDPSTLAGKVAVRDIHPGQELTLANFVVGTIGGPGIGPPVERAVVIRVISPKQIRNLTGGSYVDVWVATSRHGSSTFRKLQRDMQVLAVSTSAGTVTLRALTPQQAGRLIYVSGKTNDRLVVRPHR